MRTIPKGFVLTALALAIPAAFAQNVPFGGSVSITGITTDVSSQNRFRFEEYRDLSSGVTGGLNVGGESNAWYYNLFGENLGRDDQFITLRGGRYGVLKYELYNNDVIHNWTFGAITPFTGVGTNNLTFAGTAASTDPATWNSFDYGIQHKNYGAVVEGKVAVDSPFYARFTANRKKTEGIRPLGAPGTSPGGPAYELPAPIDWTTTDVSGEVGYSTRKMHLSLNVLWSKFEDANDFFNWRSPVITAGPNVETSTIAADNNLRRVSANAMFRQLPYDSSLALRGTYTKITNHIPVGTTFISVASGVGATRLANPNESTFDGEVVNESVSASLSSSLTRALSSKVYYNYYKRENKSSEIVFTPSGPGSGGTCDPAAPGTTATTCSTEFLNFHKDNVGVEFYYRIAPQNKLTVGFDYLDTHRERIDFDRSKETKAFVEWKNGTWDVADFRVKYIHMERKSDFLLANDSNLFERFLLRFDAAPLDRDQVKVTVDTNPLPLFDVGAEAIYKENRYKDTFLGRNKDWRYELNLSASYGDPKALRITAFADIEHVYYDSTHWVGATTTFPNTNTAGTTYLWTSRIRDKNWLVGVAADYPFSERLKIKGSLLWQQGDGGVDFNANSTVANPVNIDQYDNFRKKALNLKAIYSATKQIDVTLGAAYEKYNYSDIELNNYFYNVRTGANQNFFSGAYAFPDYRATIVYATLTYKF